MSEKSICFVTCAYKIHRDYINSFLSMNESVFNSNGINVCIVCDSEESKINERIRLVKYPINQDVFNFSKTINFGIRNSLQFDIIIKVDIDIYMSDTLVKYVIKTVDDRTGMVCCCASCSSLSDAKKKETTWPENCKIITNGKGAFFALHRSCWESLHGYNEKLFGWGSEDTNMYDRSRTSINMILSTEYPLFHLKHQNRQGTFFPYRSGENRALCREGGYSNVNWGIP